jgi:hypothetical protein
MRYNLAGEPVEPVAVAHREGAKAALAGLGRKGQTE